MRAPPGLLVCFVLLVTMSGHVHATTVLPLSLDDLAQRSDVVAHVRVGQVHVVQRDGVPFRVTEITIVESYLGGHRGEVLELWQRGDGTIFVIGDPFLEPNQEGLAFLRRVDGHIYLTALAQSFWWLEGHGEQAVAQRDLTDLAFAPFGEPREMPPDRIPWAELREMVIDACMGVMR